MATKVSVIGLGKLGSPMCAAFASKGLDVIGVDQDLEKVDSINRRDAPVNEKNLDSLLKSAIGQIKATPSIEEAVLGSEATFVIVATPSEPSGRFSLDYILPVCEKIGQALRHKNSFKDQFHVVSITSTVMPGDCDGPIRYTLERASGLKCGEQFGLCYNPEFIALGNVIENFLNPDFILIGANDPLSYARLCQIYKLCIDSPVIKGMSRINAELTKLALNSFITTKISFANMLARICELTPGANVDTVTDAIGSDSRIGHKYLKGAISYSGPCFPRDNRALSTLAEQFTGIPQVTDQFNRDQIDWLVEFVKENAEGPILILGTSYKPGTDVKEESPGIALIEKLRPDFPDIQSSKAKTVVVMQPEEQFLDLNYSGMTVIDCWRFLGHLANDPTIKYIPLGIGPCVP